MLLFLNGPPGIGKTTLARRWAGDRPLALCLDVDVVRAMLGRWESAPHDAGLAARALALAMARSHLAAGYDVVVAQYVARPPFADDLAAVVDEAGARFVEVVLTAGDAASRGADRADDVEEMVERLAAFVAGRPHVVAVEARHGDAEGTYADLLAAT